MSEVSYSNRQGEMSHHFSITKYMEECKYSSTLFLLTVQAQSSRQTVSHKPDPAGVFSIYHIIFIHSSDLTGYFFPVATTKLVIFQKMCFYFL